MINKNNIIKIIISLTLFFTFSYGETFRKVGTSVGQFLKIGVSARALAMSGAFESIANDASTIYYNPAGMVNVDNISWIGNHTNWLLDVSHDYTAVLIPVSKNSAIGLSANSLTMDEEEITTEENPHGTGFYWDANDIAVGVSYARKMTDFFSIGITGKYIAQNIWRETASTFALDVGTYLNTGFKGLIIGMSYKNFGGSLQLSGIDLMREYDPNENNTLNSNVDTRLHTEKWTLPVSFNISTSMEVIGRGNRLIQSENSSLICAVTGSHPNDDSEKLDFGFEYGLKDFLFLRFGYGLGYDLPTYSYGGGIHLNIGDRVFAFDYAYVPYGDFNDVQHFTISSTF